MKLIAAAERLVESVLEQVLRQRPIANHLSEKAAETSLTAVEQALDSLSTKRRRWPLALTVLPVLAVGRRLQLLGAFPHLHVQVPMEDRT